MINNDNSKIVTNFRSNLDISSVFRSIILSRAIDNQYTPFLLVTSCISFKNTYRQIIGL